MNKADKIINRTVWYTEHPMIFNIVYAFTETRKLKNWEVYIIIFSCVLMGLLIGYIMGSGRIPFS